MVLSPFSTWTKKWHNTTYPDISPSRPELSTKGKAIVITGGGSGIGESITRGFAEAGSTQLAILGRREAILKKAAAAIEHDYPGTTVLGFVADVSKVETVQAAFDGIIKAFGKIDVCVSNAGYLSATEPIATGDLNDWWASYEINVKGSYNIARAFLQHAKPGSTLLHITTGMAHIPTLVPGHSGYVTSKLAGAKLHEYIAGENPDIHVVNLQPGVIASDMSEKSGFPGLDNISLPRDFSVWLVSDEAKFLRGRLVWSNWDVKELLARKSEVLENQELFTIALDGASFRDWKLEQVHEYVSQVGSV